VAHVPGLLARFPPPEFYRAEDAIRDAISTRGQFNIIHPESSLKVDVIARKDTPYDLVEFSRRQWRPALEKREAYFARPEDVIIYKMIYYRQGGSERHLRYRGHHEDLRLRGGPGIHRGVGPAPRSRRHLGRDLSSPRRAMKAWCTRDP
jgi:hypothetical protein